ncbi:MAG: hypothetical protein KatS3mg048_2971 [Caldilinea sp.]|jgi:hypothetical protein|nr:MAG: hypothetical protein KatS3mg048_2971 [Caldilinea sp.]
MEQEPGWYRGLYSPSPLEGTGCFFGMIAMR